MLKTDIPPQQLAILNRCFHPRGTFNEFRQEEIEQSVAARFEKQVRLYPDQIAIKTNSQEISYGQLNREANQVAHVILAQSEAEDDPVVLLFEPGIQAIIGILGVLKSGRAFVPLDPSFPFSRNAYMVKDVGSQLILSDSKNLSLATELASHLCNIVDIENLGPDSSAENPALPTPPDALAYVMYTSGSSGQPKGVAHSQRNLLHSAMNHINLWHICSSDRMTMLYTPLSIAGLRDIFRALLNGAALYPFNLKADGIGGLAGWLRQNQITISSFVPTLFRQMLSGSDGEGGFPDYRLLFLAGEPLFQSDIDLFRQKFSQDCIMLNGLGMTEYSSIRSFFIDHETRLQGNRVPVGYDLTHSTEILLLDDNLKEVGLDCTGQIAIRSRYLAQCYWNRPDLTQTAFLDDPDGGDLRIFLTGDLGRVSEDGCLEHLGRMDSQVKVRGFRVELSEIENALIGLDAVKEAAVVADGNNSNNNQRLIAYLAPFDQAAPKIGNLQRLLRGKLPDYMIPSTFMGLDSLPKLPGGKIDRNALPPPPQGRPQMRTPFVPPRSVTEEVLAEIWAEILQLDRVGRNDDFLDLGGDSLTATALLTHVEESFGKKLPLATLIQASTVSEMADFLRNERWSSSGSCLVPIQPGGNGSPFFCVHGVGGHAIGFTALSRHLGDDQPFYGLESVGRDGEAQPLATIEAMAQHYISEIKTVQPEGPYLLGGFSMGGVIAFEMAQQLHAEGRKVALLALFDSDCHGLTGGWRRRKNFVLREIRHSLDWMRLNPMTNRRIIHEKLDVMVRTAIASSPVGKPNRQALRRYRPKSYPGKITFFWAGDRPEDPSDPRWGWRQLAIEGMDIHRIPGDHLSILREPQLQVLARHLKDCLHQEVLT